ncbi:MAG: cytochrome c peroxidase [Saprospiraceae bacterium]|nr:cytochrome c peroxidase [Saprospiraceae bacterium]
MRKYIAFLFLVCLYFQCTKDKIEFNELDFKLVNALTASSPIDDMAYYQLPTDINKIPQDDKNPLSDTKINLGKKLFFETGFANKALKPEGIGTYSCASCHVPNAGFKPNNFQGIADGGFGFGIDGDGRVKNTSYLDSEIDVQSARPLSLVNVAYVTNTFWNGQFGPYGANVGTEHLWDKREDTERNRLGFEGIETVNFAGLISHRLSYDSLSIDSLGYKAEFDEAFSDESDEIRYSDFTASLAISAYLRSIISDQAPFQRWIRGETQAMTDNMKKGAILFFSKANCSSCHYEQNLGSTEFHVLGVKDMYQRPSYNTNGTDRRNLGRGGFTGLVADYYKFKVPGLYNVGDTDFYFHGASQTKLEEVVSYKLNAKSENINIPDSLLSVKLKAITLNPEEIQDLVTFLEYGLHDPDLNRYAPEELNSGNCFPNADYQSKIDIGCSE